MPAEFNVLGLLRALIDHEVRFVVVGGVAATLHGSPLMTTDLDVVYATDSQNLARLQFALEEISAFYRDPAQRKISPDLEKLRTLKVHLLRTELGPLDLLQSVGRDRGYADLAEDVEVFDVEGLAVSTLGLEALIDAKTVAGRPKDRHALRYLADLSRRSDLESDES